MKYDKILDKICEADELGDEFIASLGSSYDDENEAARLKGKRLQKEFLEMWKEYIAESEHTLGYDFWTNFKNIGDLAEDFMLYVQNAD